MAKRSRIAPLPIPDAQAMPAGLATVRLLAGRAQLCALPHVVSCISRCLNNSLEWTLETASDGGYASLLDRVRPKEWVGVSKEFRVARFLRAICHAAAKGRISILNWWQTEYLPAGAPAATKAVIVRVAAFHGHLHVLKWLLSEERSLQTITRMSCKDQLLICQDPETVHWIHNRSRRARLFILLDRAIKQGDLEFLNWAHGHQKQHRIAFSEEAVDNAAEAGNLKMLQWLHDHEDNWHSERAMHCVAKAGHLDVLKWLESTCSEQGKFKLPGRQAALNGHLDVVKWMIEECKCFDEPARCKWLFQAMDAAIETGNWPLLRYLFRRRSKKCTTYGINKAIVRGDLEMVKWLYAKGFKCSLEVDPMEDAAKHGHLAILQWLYQNLPEESSSEEVMNIAAAKNHLQIVQWLHGNRTEGCNETAMIFAASNGDIQMVQWLYANRPEFGVKDSNSTAQNLYEDELRLQNGLLATSAMDFAAANGHLDIVKFLHERQKPCSVRTMDLAAGYGDLQVVQWLHEYRTEGCSTNAMDLAASNGHLEIVQWLHDYRTEGCTEVAVDEAAANGHLNVVRWLLDNRTEGFSDEGVHEAAANGHCEILALLSAACPDFECTYLCAQRAVSDDRFQITEWMEQYGSDHLKHHIPDMLRERTAELLSAYTSETELMKGLVVSHDDEDADEPDLAWIKPERIEH